MIFGNADHLNTINMLQKIYISNYNHSLQQPQNECTESRQRSTFIYARQKHDRLPSPNLTIPSSHLLPFFFFCVPSRFGWRSDHPCVKCATSIFNKFVVVWEFSWFSGISKKIDGPSCFLGLFIDFMFYWFIYNYLYQANKIYLYL